MAAQPGTTRQRLQTSWYMVHQSSCSSSCALQRHLRGYDTGVESHEQLGQVVQVDAQLKPSRLLRCSTDGGAAGHDPAAPPDQLVHGASVVLLI